MESNPGDRQPSTRIVQYLVRLPVIDRIKAVKDLIVNQLDGLQATSGALLANNTPRLRVDDQPRAGAGADSQHAGQEIHELGGLLTEEIQESRRLLTEEIQESGGAAPRRRSRSPGGCSGGIDERSRSSGSSSTQPSSPVESPRPFTIRMISLHVASRERLRAGPAYSSPRQR